MKPFSDQSVTTYAVFGLLAIACVAVVLIYFRPFSSKKKKPAPAKPTGPRAVIVIGDHEFEVPCVAMAATIFKLGGMHVVLASASGGDCIPEKSSLETPIAKEAGDRQDPVWMEVLNQAHTTVPLERVKAAETAILFVAGGPQMLRDLRQTTLAGSSPSPFCAFLQRLCVQVHAGGGVIGAVGHGVRGLPEEAALQEPGVRRFAGRLDSAVEEIADSMLAARNAYVARHAAAANAMSGGGADAKKED